VRKIAVLSGLTVLFAILSVTGFASGEGTRHITGKNIDVYFMNDKLFGQINNHPLWAIYNCGSDIQGEIDVNGTHHRFDLRFHRTGDRRITGSFGREKISIGTITKTKHGFVYQALIGENEYSFSVRYEEIEKEHLVNSIIEGETDGGKKVKMVVDGHLCPFATAGIILIIAGSIILP
jgi:hypothetical protein